MQPSADDETFVLRIDRMIEDALNESGPVSARSSITDLFAFSPRPLVENTRDTLVDR
jgi:hypothetical protein